MWSRKGIWEDEAQAPVPSRSSSTSIFVSLVARRTVAERPAGAAAAAAGAAAEAAAAARAAARRREAGAAGTRAQGGSGAARRGREQQGGVLATRRFARGKWRVAIATAVALHGVEQRRRVSNATVITSVAALSGARLHDSTLARRHELGSALPRLWTHFELYQE
jgi:hypothetical protein